MKRIIPMDVSEVEKSVLESLYRSNSYIAEEKYDGSRYILQIEKNKLQLTSRRESVKGGLCEKSKNIPHITDKLKHLNGYVFDGEIVAKSGKFTDVVSVMGSNPEHAIEVQQKIGKVTYYIFDILYCDSVCVEKTHFQSRRKLLEALFKENNFGKHVKLAKQVKRNKKRFYEKIVKNGGEGIVLKGIYGFYYENKAYKYNWVKVKAIRTYDAIVIGGEEGDGKYKGTLGALILGQYVNGKLVEVAKCSGMTDEQRDSFWSRIQKKKRWVIEFEAQSKTSGNRYRHPQYKRERPDKPFNKCVF